MIDLKVAEQGNSLRLGILGNEAQRTNVTCAGGQNNRLCCTKRSTPFNETWVSSRLDESVVFKLQTFVGGMEDVELLFVALTT